MFTYKKTPYKIFALGPKFCWASPDCLDICFQIFYLLTCVELILGSYITAG